MTQEDFGVELYTAITFCSGVQQLLAMINAGVHKNKDVSHLSEQYRHEKERAKVLAAAEERPVVGHEVARQCGSGREAFCR